jgi:putative tricarboxylic transport membrane protein
MAYQAWNLPLGSSRRPGPGLYPLLLCLLLAFLAFLLFILPYLRKNIADSKENLLFSGKDLKKILYLLALLFIYSFLFARLGFLLSTFLFFLLLKSLIMKSWAFVIMGAILISLLSYWIFDVLLQAQLPKGIFGI